MIDWDDVGNLEKYQEVMGQYEAYDFSKTNEFLYIINQQVIKFFADNNVSRKRVKKAKLNSHVFPIIKHNAPQFYSYDFLPGKTLYEYNNVKIFKKLLNWLDTKMWKEHPCSPKEMRSLCEHFYREKTMERLKLFKEKYSSTNKQLTVNGSQVPSIDALIKLVPWNLLYDGVPRFIHGDLQFDNILYNRNEDSFLLLDWRQDFGGRVDFGDIYYDYAKLYGGILINYDYIKANLIHFEEEGNEIFFDLALRRNAFVYEEILMKFVSSKSHDFNKVRLLVPLIYLNMSPLHQYPFDKILHALGRQMLNQVLQTFEGSGKYFNGNKQSN
jgi:thiamine kinase-like enzyme